MMLILQAVTYISLSFVPLFCAKPREWSFMKSLQELSKQVMLLQHSSLELFGV